jgi:hypothetical protein
MHAVDLAAVLHAPQSVRLVMRSAHRAGAAPTAAHWVSPAAHPQTPAVHTRPAVHAVDLAAVLHPPQFARSVCVSMQVMPPPTAHSVSPVGQPQTPAVHTVPPVQAVGFAAVLHPPQFARSVCVSMQVIAPPGPAAAHIVSGAAHEHTPAVQVPAPQLVTVTVALGAHAPQ